MATDLNQTMQQVLECDIFEYLNLENLSAEDKTKAMEDMIGSLKSRVMLRIADFLEEKGTFEQFKIILNDDNSTEEMVNTYLEENNVPVDVFTGQESIQLKSELMKIKNIGKGGQDGIS